eukprot:comp17313_c0_seq1/m.29040 comp17313_c0_seq1/g.29040  ORF comp17313_c0_seq1/g.29040 comp17313_c0_seq1/m.29040 type:complete len:424 (+) comp17313_c0_seq1:223-1494(+)
MVPVGLMGMLGAMLGLQLDPGAQLFAVHGIIHTKHLRLIHEIILEDMLLNLARIQLLAAAAHHVLEPPDNVAVSILVQCRKIARVHPAIAVNALVGLALVAPVALHHTVAASEQLARNTARHNVALAVHNLHLNMRMNAPHGRRAQHRIVVNTALERHGRRLRHPVSNRHLLHVQIRNQTIHHHNRTRRASYNTRAQTRQLVAQLRECRMRENAQEHRRNPIQRRALVLGHRFQGLAGIKALGRIHHTCPVAQRSNIAHHHPKAVVQRHRQTHHIVLSQLDPFANKEAIVHNIVVAQRGPFRHPRRARRELNIDRIVKVKLRRTVLVRQLRKERLVRLMPMAVVVAVVVVAHRAVRVHMRLGRSTRGCGRPHSNQRAGHVFVAKGGNVARGISVWRRRVFWIARRNHDGRDAQMRQLLGRVQL